jgi:AcrR family transcriptional regulator
MTRIVKAPDVRRLELLETAYGLFAVRGYEDTSVQGIVDRVGVAKGTFYHYFESKEDLLEQVAAWQADETRSPFGTPARGPDGADDVVVRLRGVLRRITGWDPSDPPAILQARLRILYLPGNLALRTRLTESVVVRVHPELESLLSQGVASGVMDLQDPDATADVVAAVWRGSVDHIAGLLLASEGRPERVPEVIAHLRAIEHAVERVLGMTAGTLRLYEPRKLRRALKAALGEAAAVPGAATAASVRLGASATKGGLR